MPCADPSLTTPSQSAALREPLCPLCGEPNHCVPTRNGNFSEPCWCERVTFPPELLARVPESKAGRACICAKCAAGAAEGRENP